jgi:hypothetical protein
MLPVGMAQACAHSRSSASVRPLSSRPNTSAVTPGKKHRPKSKKQLLCSVLISFYIVSRGDGHSTVRLAGYWLTVMTLTHLWCQLHGRLCHFMCRRSAIGYKGGYLGSSARQ